MRNALLAAAITACMTFAAHANEGKLDYQHQEKWPAALDKSAVADRHRHGQGRRSR